MCKINEPPCQLQFRSKMFHFFCPTREVEWLSLTALTELHLFSSFFKNRFTVTASRRSKAEHVRKSHSEDVCIHVRSSVEFVCRDAPALVSSIQELLFTARSSLQLKKKLNKTKQPQHQSPLQTNQHQQITQHICCFSTKSHFHPEYKTAKSLNNKLNLHFIFSQKTDFFVLKPIFFIMQNI